MLTLAYLGQQIAARRKALGLSQAVLARQAGVGHSTLEALENGRLGELGLAKIVRILSALGLEFKLQPAAPQRPTLDELLAEELEDRQTR